MKNGNLLVGIPVDIAQAKEHQGVVKELWSEHRHIRWLPLEFEHCTLAWVDVSKSSRPRRAIVRAVIGAVERSARGCPQFETVLHKFEWFGYNKDVLVITEPSRQISRKLVKLTSAVRNRIKDRNFRILQAGSFRPHISLGRSSPDIDVYSRIYTPEPACRAPFRLVVDRLVIYECLADCRLRILYTVTLPLG